MIITITLLSIYGFPKNLFETSWKDIIIGIMFLSLMCLLLNTILNYV